MPITKAIEALKKAIPEQDGQQRFFAKGDAQFEPLNQSYISATVSDIQPACIVQPRSRDEVSTFVRTIRDYAVNGDVTFAIRGGGQQPLPGCNNIPDGITLDLTQLNDFKIRKDANIVEVGPGARWGPVFEAVTKEGLGVSGERSSKSGIGGCALTGGLSFFSSRDGFICDNIVNYEIVLADGTIVNANATDNKDLWIALRGAANNLGVVTRYDFKTFKQSPFFGGGIYYSGSQFPGQIDALVTELQKPGATEDTHLMISIGWAEPMAAYFPNEPTLSQNQIYYTRNAADDAELDDLYGARNEEGERPDLKHPEVVQPFTSVTGLGIPPTFRVMTLAQAAAEQAGDAGNALQSSRCAYRNITIKADADALKAAAQIYTAALEPLKEKEKVAGLVTSFTLQPYAKSMLERSADGGGNSLGVTAEDGSLVSILLLTYWKDRADDERVESVFRSTLDEIRKSVGDKLVPFEFAYYASQHQDPIASYGAENKKQLQAVSKKYDADGLFQKGVPGGFKLF